MPYEVGSTPVGLIAEDFNEDGNPDLASVNCDSSNVSVLLGQGDGTFQEQVLYAASPSGEFIVSGDFNGDGHIDLVTSGQFANGIAVNLGRGDGTFAAPLLFGLGDAPAGGATGDFNGDGRLDLAVTNFFSPDHDVSVFLGNGDGTFQDETHFAVGDQPLGIVADDFNRDRILDLAVANSGSKSVSLLMGNGDGTFQKEARVATEPDADTLADADAWGTRVPRFGSVAAAGLIAAGSILGGQLGAR